MRSKWCVLGEDRFRRRCPEAKLIVSKDVLPTRGSGFVVWARVPLLRAGRRILLPIEDAPLTADVADQGNAATHTRCAIVDPIVPHLGTKTLMPE
jgi:hypothetical protein